MNFNINSSSNLVTEDEIKKMDNAIIYDMPDTSDTDSVNFPNVPNLLDEIANILEYMCKDDMIDLKTKNPNEFENHMEEKFSTFSFKYYAVFQKLLSGEDLGPLFSMLAAIEKIKNGNVSLEDAEKGLGEELAKKYIHPKR